MKMGKFTFTSVCKERWRSASGRDVACIKYLKSEKCPRTKIRTGEIQPIPCHTLKLLVFANYSRSVLGKYVVVISWCGAWRWFPASNWWRWCIHICNRGRANRTPTARRLFASDSRRSFVWVGGREMMASMVGQRDQKQPFLVTCRLPSHLFVSIKTCFISFLTREYPLQAPPPPPTSSPTTSLVRTSTF